jgi:hypothetical protein
MLKPERSEKKKPVEKDSIGVCRWTQISKMVDAAASAGKRERKTVERLVQGTHPSPAPMQRLHPQGRALAPGSY